MELWIRPWSRSCWRCLLIGLMVHYYVVETAKVDECCRSHNIPENCIKTLCNPPNTPGDFDIYNFFLKKNHCTKHLPQIAECLADGRNHSACCHNEAKDPDEAACFGLCEGSGQTPKGLKPYQACLAINVKNMFGCFLQGYEKSPSPPQNVRVKSVDTNSITIQWDLPEQNAGQVSNYQLYAQEMILDAPEHAALVTGLEPKEIVLDVTGTEVTVNDLEPGTSYSVSVIAIGQMENQTSLPTKVITVQTTGIAPKIHGYQDVVHSSEGVPSVVLACSVHMSSITKDSTKFQWFHKKPGGTMQPLDDNGRYNMSYYVFSYEKPREYVSTLEITKLTKEDFGLYQCTVADNYGTAEAEVQLALSAGPLTPQEEPPKTPLQCCKSRGVDNRCLPMCGAGHANTDSKRYIPRPYMPSNCGVMISKVLSCAMPSINDGACCLREHVPRPCMYLCDSSITPTNTMDPMCIHHMSSVEKCRIHGVNSRPSIPHLKLKQNPEADTTTATWEKVELAAVYHLYWRASSEDPWQKKLTKTLTETVTGSKELVLVAANTFGLSQAVRMSRNNGKWSRS